MNTTIDTDQADDLEGQGVKCQAHGCEDDAVTHFKANDLCADHAWQAWSGDNR